jgi:hypothetical protein
MLPSYQGFLVRFADSGELEDGVEIAPVSCHCAGDRGFGWLDPSFSFEFSTLSEDGPRAFFRSFGAGLFSGSVARLAPWAAFFRRSAAWVCRCAFLRGVLLCGSWLGLGFSLGCRGLAGGGARAPGFDWGAEFGVFDQVLWA